ncbi:MAG: hypothetical protein JW982_03045 [Spirochaetes bacterium]|nr:hypothetical protein [Spirochaetota bacterium]
MSYKFTKETDEEKEIFLYSDGYDNLVKIFINQETKIISTIFLSSSTYGTVYWDNGRGLIFCHSWDNPSGIAEHYPAIIQNGSKTIEYAKECIIPDLFKMFNKNRVFVSYIINIIVQESFNEQVNLSLLEELHS